nr:MAG TPA: hypothetical protein [Caudoviricetes sp.]
MKKRKNIQRLFFHYIKFIPWVCHHVKRKKSKGNSPHKRGSLHEHIELI